MKMMRTVAFSTLAVAAASGLLTACDDAPTQDPADNSVVDPTPAPLPDPLDPVEPYVDDNDCATQSNCGYDWSPQQWNGGGDWLATG